MAAAKKTVKVYANWRKKSAVEGDKVVLWGTSFEHDGKGYCATVCPELFKSLLDADKVIKG